MANYKIFYATNRKHKGKASSPSGYGNKFSDDGVENLRFGKVTVVAEKDRVKEFLNEGVGFGQGDGLGLAKYFKARIQKTRNISIKPYREVIDPRWSETDQEKALLGSLKMFDELKKEMLKGKDIVVQIHGFNVNWENAVSGAIALQEMLNRKKASKKGVVVVLFSWPSDGLALPFVSYKSDRTEATGSGMAVGRAFLKLRDFLFQLKREAINGDEELCHQKIHLLCHSMGNFVLQNAINRMVDFTAGQTTPLPPIFEHTFLCAPDVDSSVLESNQPLGRLHELTEHISVYYNRFDLAMYVSDYTKGNPKRLGTNGAAHPTLLPDIAHQIDCSPIDTDKVEHGYFMIGDINYDIRLSIDDVAQTDERRRRVRSDRHPNVWAMSDSH